MQLWFWGNKIEKIVTLAILVRISTMTTILKCHGNVVSTSIVLLQYHSSIKKYLFYNMHGHHRKNPRIIVFKSMISLLFGL
jgi:hypothetical protein